MINPSTINVLFMASEAEPLIKVGGLGDVAGSLPRALMNMNLMDATISLDVRLVLPYHPLMRVDEYSPRQVAEYTVRATGQDISVNAFEIELHGLKVYLIGGTPIEQETGVYSADLVADGYKYVFFSQAALQLPRILNWKPDILHANDWHTSPAVYSLTLNRSTDPFFSQTSSLLTIHNLPYLGAMTSSALTAFDLPPAHNTSLPAWANHMALPLGLLAADRIVAVSPSYAKEIMTEKFGSGLHAFLRAHSKKIIGILNGLDTQKWNPNSDEVLTKNFSAENLQARSANKSFLQQELGLDQNERIPLLAMVTRMDPQKGVDIAVEALRHLLESADPDTPPFQAVILGTGDPTLEGAVHRLGQDFPSHVRARITYNEKLSRYFYAGADAFLMPSRYEPCGLSQMIAMHYGCLPIAHATGGLSDTIKDPLATDQSTGFLFKPATSEAFAASIRRALTIYRGDQQSWQEMQIRGMRQDFSWDKSALEYLKQYQRLLDLQKNSRKYV